MTKAIHYAWLIALLLFPVVLWLLPADYFTEHTLLTCPSQSLFDIECLGCGMTRAVMFFHHFEFAEAVFYNPAVVVVYPFAVWLWQHWVRAELKYLRIWPKTVATENAK